MASKTSASDQNPPQFVNDDIFAFLQENFNLHLTDDAASDVEKLLLKKPA